MTTANGWTLLPTLPPIPHGELASIDVAVLMRLTDGRLIWDKGRIIAIRGGGNRWQVATPSGCTVLAWKVIELPDMAELRR